MRWPDVEGIGVGVPLNIIMPEPSSVVLFHGMSFEVQLYRDSSEGRGCGNGNAGGLEKYQLSLLRIIGVSTNKSVVYNNLLVLITLIEHFFFLEVSRCATHLVDVLSQLL